MEERIIIPRLREPRDQNQTTDADDAAGAATAASCSSGEESTDGDLEFEFPSLLGTDHASPTPADHLFAHGRIRPAAFYPVFGRRASSAGDADGLAPAPTERRTRGQLGRLFLEESRAWNSSSSSSTGSSSSATTTDDGDGLDGGLEGAAPESYCVWAPGGGGKTSESPRAAKSGSTGSSVARWRRISDLVVGRSQSDGKEKFLFLPVNPPTPPPKQQEPKPRPRAPNPVAGGGTKNKKKGSEIGTVAAAHRMAYGAKAGVGVAPAAATPRRTFLPYREELVGFFANVNGISRSHAHPY